MTSRALCLPRVARDAPELGHQPHPLIAIDAYERSLHERAVTPIPDVVGPLAHALRIFGVELGRLLGGRLAHLIGIGTRELALPIGGTVLCPRSRGVRE